MPPTKRHQADAQLCENAFSSIAAETLLHAARVRCSPGQYLDGLQLMAEEIQMAIMAAKEMADAVVTTGSEEPGQ